MAVGDFRCTFGDVAFRNPDPSVLDRLERFGLLTDPRDFMPERIFPGPALVKLGVPDLMPYPPAKINQWFYPVGASRTSVFRGIMSADDLETVEALTWIDGVDVPSAQTFKVEATVSTDDTSASTIMFLLPPLPICDDLFLVTLVDERYYWHQMKSAGVITCEGSTSDWSEILDQLEAALGITLTYDAISADYGYPEPDSAIYSSYESPAVLLDMVAANVGCAVVRALDGTYSLVRWAASQTTAESNRPVHTAIGGRPVGSTDTTTRYRAVMPESVTVVFPKWVDGTGYHEPTTYRQHAKDSYGAVFAKVRTLADLGSPYSTYSNTGLTKVIHTTAKARFTLAGDATPNNEAALTTLAAKIAKDYYDARTAWLNESYRGIRSLTPEGVSDVLYCFDRDGAFTRVLPPPFNAGYHNFQHSLAAVAIPDGFTVADDKTNSFSGRDKITINNSTVTDDGSGDSTYTIDDASPSASGLVNTDEQRFAGLKIFEDAVEIEAGADERVLTVYGNSPATTVPIAAIAGGLRVSNDNTDPWADDAGTRCIDILPLTTGSELRENNPGSTAVTSLIIINNASEHDLILTTTLGEDNPRYGVRDNASAVSMGMWGTPGPGFTVKGGIVDGLGSGSFFDGDDGTF